MKEEKKSNKTKSPLRSVGGVAGLFVIIISLIILGLIGLRAIGTFLIVSTDISPGDAIIVLSGGDETRMQTALKLYDEDYGKIIILTETGEIVEGYEHLHSFAMRIQLLANGIPSGNILLTDEVVSSTKDEARAVKNLMLSRQMTSGIIVTDSFHTRRAYKLFIEEFKDTGIRLSIRPTESGWYFARNWYLTVDGWKFTLLEYGKMIADYFQINVG